MKGIYILILELPCQSQIRIGRLGKFDFPSGRYAYVGSAWGSGGLAARLRHHKNSASKPHWHIDFLQRSATIIEIWFAAQPPANEHQWACQLQNITSKHQDIPGFGASDCRCPSHLFRLPEQLSLAEIRRSLQRSNDATSKIQVIPISKIPQIDTIATIPGN